MHSHSQFDLVFHIGTFTVVSVEGGIVNVGQSTQKRIRRREDELQGEARTSTPQETRWTPDDHEYI